MSTILIVENNKDFAYVIHWFFAGKGHKVSSSPKGEEALTLYEQEKPDVILLDISLDGAIDGKEVARRIRAVDRHTPILFMSGENNSPTDVVDAFGIGGNYFIKKPVSIEELDAHIQSALNRHTTKHVYTLGSLVFNIRERTLAADGKLESLTEKEALVLKELAEQPNTLVDTTTILKNVWGGDDKEESLRNCISSLRKKIEKIPVTIDTVKGKGYRLCIVC